VLKRRAAARGDINHEERAMNAVGRGSIPLHLLYEEGLERWRSGQPPRVNHWLAEQGFGAERNRVLLVPDDGGSIGLAVCGLGRRQGALSLWQAAAVADSLPPHRYRLSQTFTAAEAEQLCLGFAHAGYRFDRYRRTAGAGPASLEAPTNADPDYVAAATEALSMARDWINTPAADFGPAELAAAARALADRHGAEFREWQGEELRENFPAIHAVGRASAAAPRLAEVRWSAGAGRPQVVLVGKGVCFDSGGLDIKSGAGMALMKKDMGGAAVALALAHMLMRMGLRADLRVLIPAVENAIAGNAFRPGDVLATRKGLSVEVGNTDAEGRLVLCDALALADADSPDLIIDFATLTGAARVALGPELPALFGNDAQMVADLARTSAAEHDDLWPMPLWSPYADELGSKIADLNNVSASPHAGAIFGALFLQRFVTTPRWLHIDLYAWNAKDRPGRGVGAEPQAVRAVYRYLAGRYGVARARTLA
jgi:leucyl aminopeptidase